MVADTHAAEGSLIHWSLLYDIMGRSFTRKTDKPILDLAEVGPGDRILDIGTGPGYLARAAAPIVGPSGEAVGIDPSPEMVARATQLARSEGSSARFVQAVAQDLPFEDASFDAAVSRLAMHHIPTDLRALALAEVMRTLAPGGRFVVADMRRNSAVDVIHSAIRRAHRNAVDDSSHVAELVRSAGFVDVTVGRVGMLAYVKARKPSA